jgi:hypothetical protein
MAELSDLEKELEALIKSRNDFKPSYPVCNDNPLETFMLVREHGRPFGEKPVTATRMAVREHGQPYSGITTNMAVKEHGQPYPPQTKMLAREHGQ